MAPTTAAQDNNSAEVSSDGGGGDDGKVQAQKAIRKNDTQDSASNPKQSGQEAEKIDASLASELCLPDTSSGSTKKRGRPRKTTQSTEESEPKKKRSSIEKATEEYWKEAKEHGNLKEPIYKSTTNMTTATQQVAKADDNLLPPALKKNKNGTTDFGRIRPCMCTTPSVCRELSKCIIYIINVVFDIILYRSIV